MPTTPPTALVKTWVVFSPKVGVGAWRSMTLMMAVTKMSTTVIPKATANTNATKSTPGLRLIGHEIFPEADP